MPTQVSPSPGFDQYADAYDATVQAAIGASGESVGYFARLKARLAAQVAPARCAEVLDFGCGVGNVARALAVELPGSRVTGVDASPASIEAAARRGGAVFVVNDEAGLPFADGSFDLVTAACVFHHVPPGERVRWAREIARVLRPGGRLAMFEHNPLNPLTRRVVRRVPFDAGVRLLGLHEARALVRQSELRVVHTRCYFFFPRWLAALRFLEPALGRLPVGAQHLVVGER
jgi:SAM-dependent methyltransferase